MNEVFHLAGAIVAGGNNEGEDVGAEVVRLVILAIVPAPYNLQFGIDLNLIN